MTSLLNSYDYSKIYLLDSKGDVLLVAGSESEAIDAHDLDIILETLKKKEIRFSDLHHGELKSEIHLDLIVPLLSPQTPDAPCLGTIILRMDPYQFLFPLIQSWPAPSPSAETLLVRREGEEVLFLNELRHRRDTTLSFKIPLARKDDLTVMAVLGKEGIGEGIDYRGIKVLAARQAIPESSWFIVSKIDFEEIYGPIQKKYNLASILRAVIILGIGLSMAIIWRHQRTQHYRREYETEKEKLIERQLLHQKHAQLNLLREELITSKTLGEKLRIITDGLVVVFKADFARIWIIKPGDRCSQCIHGTVKEGPHVCRYKDQCLHLLASSGRYIHIDGEVHGRVPFGCYKIGQLASGDLPGFVTNEVVQDPRFHNPEWANALGLVSFAGYRLRSAEGVSMGVMALFSQRLIPPEEEVLLAGLANSTAQVIQNARIEEELRESEERYRTAIEQSNDGIALVKGERHLFVNQKMVEIFGYDQPEEIIGQPITMLIQADDQERVMGINLRRQKGEAASPKYEFSGRRKNGDPVPIEVSATRTVYQGEAVSLAFLRDITDRKLAEEALRTLSLKDDLTGLYNRRGFFTLAEQGLKTAQRMGIEMLLIFGDLDKLKKINDTLGHKEGDQALKDISQILKETFRESDIIARIGGDEFVILAINSLETTAEKLINRFETILLDHPLQRERPFALSLSLGVACFDPQNPSSIEVMLSQADAMMYENKKKRRHP